MKNYKQILEAINRGIKFALDDYNDQEELQGQINSKVKYQGGTKEYLDLMKEVVDLGLPSGTLWCKYNLGVDLDLLSKPEDWYGDYYAWGELEPNKTDEYNEIYFDWGNYKFGNYNKLTKYCNNPKRGLNNFTDNLTELLPEDDAAYQNKKLHNFKFHIPTKEQCEELIKYTNNYWVNNYDPNKSIHNPKNDKGIKGLNGRVFVEKNGNQLFIPAAGRYFSPYNENDGSECYLWSSSINNTDYPKDTTYVLNFNRVNNYMIYCERFKGQSIRPVINL